MCACILLAVFSWHKIMPFLWIPLCFFCVRDCFWCSWKVFKATKKQIAQKTLKTGGLHFPVWAVKNEFVHGPRRPSSAGKSQRTKTKNTNKNEKTTRKSPSQICVSSVRKTANQTQKRGRSPNNTHQQDLPKDTVVWPLYLPQKHAKMN